LAFYFYPYSFHKQEIRVFSFENIQFVFGGKAIIKGEFIAADTDIMPF
jgi:hypothetical protein